VLRRFAATLAVAGAAVVPLAVGASAASAATKPAAITATTTITNRPDSGTQNRNTWAPDKYTRVATIQRVGEVAASNCPNTDTGHCYVWNLTIKDSGDFTTIAGNLAPRVGLLDGAPSGQFYSSWKTASASHVPETQNDNGSSRPAARRRLAGSSAQAPSSTARPMLAGRTSAPRLDGRTR
jgi:hypothetical protein